MLFFWLFEFAVIYCMWLGQQYQKWHMHPLKFDMAHITNAEMQISMQDTVQ